MTALQHGHDTETRVAGTPRISNKPWFDLYSSPEMVTTRPRIPYGEASFRRIRLNGWLYVDKTPFVRRLEEERYVFFIRPRRFGKTCWLSLLECYYERRWAEDFDILFGGTEIGRAPTAERHRYVTLRFNFSVVNDAVATLEREFETYCLIRLRGALERHPDLFPKAAQRRILAPATIANKLAELFQYAGEHGIPLYVLIDEYDNFANTILAHSGADAYEQLTHGGGFYRNFFAALKGGTEQNDGGLERLFITGVSPVTLDDVTSGFNIGTNLSLEPDFNEMLGFTDAEVRGLLELYRDRGVFSQDLDGAMDVMREWYDGYRFAKDATIDLYNTDMVLYYLQKSMPNRTVPDYLIDTNVRIDYGKLRHLLVVNRGSAAGEAHLNGNFDLLRGIIGTESADAAIQPGFPLKRLTRRQNFLSLLHYFGLLSIRAVAGGVPRLGIPNQTVKQLMYGYLREAYEDAGTFDVDLYDFEQRMMRMANEGQLAAGVRAAGRGDRRADRHPGLHRGREGTAGVPGGVPERDRLLRVPIGGRVGQGTRGHRPGAAAGAVPAPGARLPDRAEVPAPERVGGRGAHHVRDCRSQSAAPSLPGG